MEANTSNRNYTTISPSAKALLMMKGLTSIPYARQTAELMAHPEPFIPDYTTHDFGFWARVTHFEARYQSIDQLIEGLNITNVLELSSGFSFRGLQAVQDQPIHYIDTDLPEIIVQKQSMLAGLQEEGKEPKGKLEMLPLNALDESAFKEIVSRFPEGPIAIVNEGLMMYLGEAEKRQLCSIIRSTLQQRGGYWITADIYFQSKLPSTLEIKDDLQQFLDQHNIEANKFANAQAAEAFLHSEGLIVDKEAVTDYATLGTIPYLMQSMSDEQKANIGKIDPIQATWRLKLAD